MSVISYDYGYFQVTSVSFSKSVITMPETVSVTVAVKNTSGQKITNMSVDAYGYYDYRGVTNPHGGAATFTTRNIFGGNNGASVSWANNATRTFTFDFTFSAGYYAPYSGRYLLNFDLDLSIITDNDFPSSNYDNINGLNYGLDPASDLLTIIPYYDNPRLSFAAVRATNGAPNDEGESLLTSLVLTHDDVQTDITDHGYTASITCDPAPASACALNATIAEMLAGIVDSPTAIAGTFNNGTTYRLTLTVTNGYETAEAVYEISRAFANLHLSGCSTGGVAFGRFSTSTEGSPKLESEFPAHFYGGIADFGGSLQCGSVSSLGNTSGGSYKNKEITFPKAYAPGTIPVVMVGFASSSTAGNFGRGCVAVLLGSVTNTGFTLRYYNGDSSARNPEFVWIAIGQV